MEFKLNGSFKLLYILHVLGNIFIQAEMTEPNKT